MGKIQALNTVEEGEFQTCDSSLLSGMDVFGFGYKEWRILCRNKTLPGNTASGPPWATDARPPGQQMPAHPGQQRICSM